MNPLRSISMLPKVSESQGNEKPFDNTYVDNGKHIKNYQAYSSEIDTVSKKDISWLTDIPDDKVFLEVSYKDPSNNYQFTSRKFDFGNFLRYIGNCLSILEKGINDIYLTEERAEELYLPIGGGILTGPLTIAYTNKTSPALKINATDSIGEKCGLVVYGDITSETDGSSSRLTYNSLYTRQLNCETIDSTVSIQTNTLVATTGNFNELTTNTLTAFGQFDLGDGKLEYDGNGGDVQSAGITNTGRITTEDLTVTRDVKFEQNVTVGQNLSVDGTSTLGSSASTTGNFSANTATIESELTSGSATINGTVTASGTVSSTGGDIIGGVVKGKTQVQVGDGSSPETYMNASTGLHALNHISQLTAQYACWA